MWVASGSGTSARTRASGPSSAVIWSARMARHAIRGRGILARIRPFVTAGAGFLLAVLWFDLMFDVQLVRRGEPRDSALESIAAYYRRVTTAARSMNRLVAAVMLAPIAAIVAQIRRG